jgi:hypothetical protein
MMKKFLGATPSQPKAEADPELHALRQRVAELEERLEKGGQAKRRKGVKR